MNAIEARCYVPLFRELKISKHRRWFLRVSRPQQSTQRDICGRSRCEERRRSARSNSRETVNCTTALLSAASQRPEQLLARGESPSPSSPLPCSRDALWCLGASASSPSRQTLLIFLLSSAIILCEFPFAHQNPHFSCFGVHTLWQTIDQQPMSMIAQIVANKEPT